MEGTRQNPFEKRKKIITGGLSDCMPPGQEHLTVHKNNINYVHVIKRFDMH